MRISKELYFPVGIKWGGMLNSSSSVVCHPFVLKGKQTNVGGDSSRYPVDEIESFSEDLSSTVV